MPKKLAPGTVYTYRWKDKHPEKARESHRKAQHKWRHSSPDVLKKIYDRKKAWDKDNRVWLNEYGRNQYYVKKYGITAAQRDAEIAARNSQCDCCGQKKKLCVDHFHGTKLIRGFLCDGCNTLIGKFKDCPIAIRQLADYAEKRQCPSALQLHLPWPLSCDQKRLAALLPDQ